MRAENGTFPDIISLRSASMRDVKGTMLVSASSAFNRTTCRRTFSSQRYDVARYSVGDSGGIDVSDQIKDSSFEDSDKNLMNVD
jgi:hypothetical protein